MLIYNSCPNLCNYPYWSLYLGIMNIKIYSISLRLWARANQSKLTSFTFYCMYKLFFCLGLLFKKLILKIWSMPNIHHSSYFFWCCLCYVINNNLWSIFQYTSTFLRSFKQKYFFIFFLFCTCCHVQYFHFIGSSIWTISCLISWCSLCG